MRTTIIAVLATGVLVTILGHCESRGQPMKAVNEEQPKLWAAASMSRPLFDPYTFNVGGPEIHLGLVNDDARTRETGLRESVLIVNDRPVQGERWDSTLKQRLRGDTWEKLQPGEHTVISCPLWDFVKEPGTYRVSWKGKHFQSPEAVLRILPRDPTPSKESGVKLWAVTSVVPPVFVLGGPSASQTMLSFYLVNDGKEMVDTGTDDSILLLNDQRLGGWEWNPRNFVGPWSAEWTRLPAGGHTGMSRYSLPQLITKPGSYRLSWRGKNFQSPEVTFRVMPAKAK